MRGLIWVVALTMLVGLLVYGVFNPWRDEAIEDIGLDANTQAVVVAVIRDLQVASDEIDEAIEAIPADLRRIDAQRRRAEIRRIEQLHAKLRPLLERLKDVPGELTGELRREFLEAKERLDRSSARLVEKADELVPKSPE
jgi:hypothetical protein